MKKIAILGSTGSIGVNALDIARNHKDKFEVIAISGNKNIQTLVEQCLEFKPKFVVIEDDYRVASIKSKTSHLDIKFISGKDAFNRLSNEIECDILISAISGIAGLIPTYQMIKTCKTLAIANKESIVCAWDFIKEECNKYNVKINAIDSEHNSINQLLDGRDINKIDNIIITASGGPFLNRDITTFDSITFDEAIKHPRWNMGYKISIDSATLVNKGLELIEATKLFDIDYNRVKTLIHPQSIIHGMLEYKDGSVMSFMSNPDMRLHIANCMGLEKNIDIKSKPMDFKTPLTFEEVDHKKFRTINLAKYAIKYGKEIQYNSANEIAVEKFKNGEIKFNQIADIIENSLDKEICKISSPFDVLEAHAGLLSKMVAL
jgi:1-deoxy-D-xylulose-5-phosphate reductoisomerase